MPENGSSAAAVSSSASRLWITTGSPSSSASSSCASNSCRCSLGRRVAGGTVSSPVSPTATAFGWSSSSRSSSRRPRSALPRWCGSMPSAANDALVRVGDGERRTTRLDAGADRHDARDAGRPGSLDEEAAGSSHASRCACESVTRPRRAVDSREEWRVRARCPREPASCPTRRSSQPRAAVGRGPRGSVRGLGRYARERDGDDAEPSTRS